MSARRLRRAQPPAPPVTRTSSFPVLPPSKRRLILASRSARANRESAVESFEDARFQQELTTTNQFFDALAAVQLVRVREASVRRADEQLKVAIARLRAGAAIRSDSLRSLVTLGNVRLVRKRGGRSGLFVAPREP